MAEKTKKSKPVRGQASRPAEKPVSLKPLKLEEALEGLLRTRPDKKKPRS